MCVEINCAVQIHVLLYVHVKAKQLQNALSRPTVISLELEVQFLLWQRWRAQIISSDKTHEAPCYCLSLWKRRSAV